MFGKNKFKLFGCFAIILIIFIITYFNILPKSIITIDSSIDVILSDLDIKKYKITTLGNYADLDFEKLTSEVTDDEIEEFKNNILASHTQQKVTDKKYVEKGDVVNVDYITYLDNNILNIVKDNDLIVGKGQYNIQFENAIVGAEVGKSFNKVINTTVDSRDSEVLYKITINSINEFVTHTLNDEFVRNNFKEEGLTNVEEFNKWVEKELIEMKKEEDILKNNVSFFDSLINNSSFEIDKDQIADYSINIVEKYNSIYNIYGYENLEDYYIHQLNLTKDGFYEMCYSEGEYIVKKYILIGAIVNKENIAYTDKELEEYCKQNNLPYDEIKDNKLSKATLLCNIYESKIIKMFIDKD